MRPSASAKTRSVADLVGQPVGVGLGVGVGDAEQHQQAGADRAGDGSPSTVTAARDTRWTSALTGRAARPPPARAATMQRFTPVPSSRPARCVSARQDLDPPAEVVGAARGGADPQVQRRAGAEPDLQAPQRVVQQRGAGRAVVLEARARAARREHELERDARGVGRHQHGLVVDRDDPLAPADLLLHEVGEQVAAHRPHRVGAEALALAGDGGGHEVQRVAAARACAAARRPPPGRSLTIRCRQAAPACARIRSRQVSTASATCSAESSRERS